MSLEDTVEIKELLFFEEVKKYLSKGWKLINVLQYQSKTEVFCHANTAYPVYIVSRTAEISGK